MQNNNKFVIEVEEEGDARDEENPKMRNNSSSKKNKSPQKKINNNRSDAYQIQEFSNDVSKSEKPEEESQIIGENHFENKNNNNSNLQQLPTHLSKNPPQYSPSNNPPINKMLNNNHNSNIHQDNIQTTKNNYSTEQLKHPVNLQQLSEEKDGSPESNPIQLTKLQGVDFTDPKNRQILEDQFFNNGENPRNSNEFDKQQEEKNSIIPKKFQYLALFLAFSGVILIIVGFIVAFAGSNTKILKGGAFWTIGAICCIPGIYYSIKIFRSRVAKNQEERLQAAQDIPRY